MCKQFKENRGMMLDLIYELDEFTEDDIQTAFLKRSNNEFFITDYFTTTKDFLFSLCEKGILKFDGRKFKVIPPERRISYRMHFLGILV